MVELPVGRSMRPRPAIWGGLGLLLLAMSVHPQLVQASSGLGPPPGNAETVSLDPFPKVQPYDLGGATLTQPGLSEPWQTMPYQLNGTLGIPEGEGPFPIVVLLHGRHPGCHFVRGNGPSPWPCPAGTETRFDQGFAYLAQALAEAGYLTLAPNLNAAYANAYGATAANRADLVEARGRQIVEAHLNQMAAAHGGEPLDVPVLLSQKVDFSRLGIIGYSLGGGLAVHMSQRDASAPDGSSTPETIHRPFSMPQALLLVSPTPSRSMQQEPEAYQLPEVPTSIIAGGCDRDIYDLSSLYYFETANNDVDRQTSVTALLVPGANHNFFNAAVQQDDYYRHPDNDPLCSPQQSTLRLSRVEQETLLVQHALSFLAPLLARSRRQNIPSQGSSDTMDANFSARYLRLRNWAIPSRHRLVIFRAREALADADGPVASGDVVTKACPSFQPCSGEFSRMPAFPSVLHIGWSRQGGSLRFSLPPDLDLAHAHSLRLRVAPGPGQQTIPSQDGFAIVLRDHSGQAVRVEVPASTPALYRFPAARLRDEVSQLAYPSLVTIPLRQFRGVAWSEISMLELVFDPDTVGNVYLAEITLTMP